MTKVVLQVGILAFCVSAVLFGTQDLPLFAIVARAFIVFIAVVLAQVLLLMVATTMKHGAPQRTASAQRHEDHETAAQGPGAPSSQTPAAA